MENLIWIALLVISGIIFYYSYLEMFFKKRRVVKIEKSIKTWSALLPTETSFYSNEDMVKSAFEIIEKYEECNFSDEQINLKIEIACLLIDYVMVVFRISNNEGAISVAPSDCDISHNEDKLTVLSRKKEHLEPILINTFLYINDLNKEDD